MKFSAPYSQEVWAACRLGTKSQRVVEDVEQYEPDLLMLDNDRPEDRDDFDRTLGIRRGIDLATTLERIEKNFVITDPRLPDNPIVSQSAFIAHSPWFSATRI